MMHRSVMRTAGQSAPQCDAPCQVMIRHAGRRINQAICGVSGDSPTRDPEICETRDLRDPESAAREKILTPNDSH